jgi:hypothetical protein
MDRVQTHLGVRFLNTLAAYNAASLSVVVYRVSHLDVDAVVHLLKFEVVLATEVHHFVTKEIQDMQLSAEQGVRKILVNWRQVEWLVCL